MNRSTGKIEWTRKFPVLYDCEVLPGSGKIVVLTESNKRIQKQVFSAKGQQISQQTFSNITGGSDPQIQWSAAGVGTKESVAVMSGDRLSVYQYPWKKPVYQLSMAASEDKKDESVSLADAQFQFPYFIAKVNGLSLGQSRDYYKVINVSSKKLNLILFPTNVSSSFRAEGASLVVNTSSIGSPLGLSTYTPIVYARYDLKTGKAGTTIKRTFTQPDSNWSSSYFDGRLLLTDTERGEQTLLNQSGQVLAERTAVPADLRDKLVGYSGAKAFILAPFGKQSAELRSIFEK
ncbi:hypothetical protein QWJ34_08810 [Saccharibacillus sp. CPCC 101409]|uniref:hypothetical protein n=1 Tax=Saccharibacillus sp. CPCC 101409 TaxID=3058041 RepID=UPI002671D620|nr:hypothetical protein [Saccharibacillus sp. CPCC 101409]MDO3409860.1 hypothetical protein [Saccharibacillus sp. CPCC 101409]